MADKGFISPVATKFADEIKNDNSKITVAGVTYKDKVYAFLNQLKHKFFSITNQNYQLMT